MEAAFAVTFALIALAGLAIGRWSVLLLPLVVWPAVYGAIAAGLVGHGFGDHWLPVAAAITGASVAVTAGMILLGGGLRSHRPSS